MHRDQVWAVNVDAGHRVIVYEGPSLGTKRAAPPFLAGSYGDAWRNAPRKARAMRDDRPKLVVVEETTVEPRELLELIWWDDKRKVVQRLEPGDYDARHDVDFINDRAEQIRVPENGIVTVFESSDHSRRFIDLQDGHHKLSDYGLKTLASSMVYALDGWDAIGRELGRVTSKKETGEPIVVETELDGIPGSSVETYVDIGEEESESTNWHLNSSITASVEIGSDAAGYKVGLSSTTEAGGGGEQGKGKTAQAGTKVIVPIPSPPPEHAGDPSWSGLVVATIIARRFYVKQEVIRKMKNRRTGRIAEQSGTISAKRFEYRTQTRFKHV